VEIAVLGSVNADIVYDVSRLPLAGETLVAAGLALGAGGKASNASVALARLGAKPRLIGCIGDDALGDGAIAALRRAGVGWGGAPPPTLPRVSPPRSSPRAARTRSSPTWGPTCACARPTSARSTAARACW
jgi:hypothetical protein